MKISSSISPGHSVPEYTATELTCEADANPLPFLNLFYTDGQKSWQLSPEWVVDTIFTLRIELSRLYNAKGFFCRAKAFDNSHVVESTQVQFDILCEY